MADTQQQTLQVTGGNEATDKFLSYYNQLLAQLGGSGNGQITAQMVAAPQRAQWQTVAAPDTVQAYTIASPGKLEAQQIAAPSALTAQQIAAPERVNIEEQTQEGLAKQIAAYLRPYTESAIQARQRQTGRARAGADADAYSRGMGASTYLSDAKNQMAMDEAYDISNMENNYLSNLGQQVFNSYQNYLQRKQAADQFNIQNAMAAEQWNAGQRAATDQWNAQMAYKALLDNANLKMEADKYNLGNDLAIAQYNAGTLGDAARFNAQMAYQAALANSEGQLGADQAYYEMLWKNDQANADRQLSADQTNANFWANLLNMAWSRAGQLYGLEPVGGGGGGATDNSGIEENNPLRIDGNVGYVGNKPAIENNGRVSSTAERDLPSYIATQVALQSGADKAAIAARRGVTPRRRASRRSTGGGGGMTYSMN